MQIIVRDQGPDRKPKVHLRVSGGKTRLARKRKRLLIAGKLQVAVKVVAREALVRHPVLILG